jgi:hypothetical protein
MKRCTTCGVEKPMTEFYTHIRFGHQAACKDCQKARNARPHFKRWRNIRDRVFNTQHKEYRNYGGRGITMHSEWAKSYAAFRHWIEENLGPCPAGHSLDRIDNDGNYAPGNLRWATPMMQTQNRRVSVAARWEERKAA